MLFDLEGNMVPTVFDLYFQTSQGSTVVRQCILMPPETKSLNSSPPSLLFRKSLAPKTNKSQLRAHHITENDCKTKGNVISHCPVTNHVDPTQPRHSSTFWSEPVLIWIRNQSTNSIETYRYLNLCLCCSNYFWSTMTYCLCSFGCERT